MGKRIQISDWTAVESLIAETRNRGRVLSNCFLDLERVSEWCSAGDFYADEYDGVSVFWRNQESFCNLFFFASSMESLSSFLAGDVCSPQKRIVVDLIGPDPVRLPLVNAFLAAGYNQISELVRMSRKTPEVASRPTVSVMPPDERDIFEIQSIFREHFNPEVEQLPSDGEISRWIAKGGILVRRDDRGRVHSFIIYDLNKASLYLRYWFVCPQVRDRGVGGHLMNMMFYHARFTKRQYFWVITDNVNAIKRYEHYGFHAEPMRDVVLAKDI